MQDPNDAQQRASIAAVKLNEHFEGQGIRAKAEGGQVSVTVEGLELNTDLHRAQRSDNNTVRRYGSPEKAAAAIPDGLISGSITTLQPEQQLNSESTGRLNSAKNALRGMIGGDISAQIRGARQMETAVADNAAEPGKVTATVTLPGEVLRDNIAGYDLKAEIARRQAEADRNSALTRA